MIFINRARWSTIGVVEDTWSGKGPVVSEVNKLTWMKSSLFPLFKGKGNGLKCENYTGMKFMSQTLKLKIIERILWDNDIPEYLY